jgi:hypothetical protein
MFRTVCRRTARAGTAVGGYATVARFEGPAAISRGQAAALKEQLADPGIVAVDIWHATAAQNAATKEASVRREADRNITAAVIIEATGEASAQRARVQLPQLLGPEAVPSAIGIYQLIATQEAPRR